MAIIKPFKLNRNNSTLLYFWIRANISAKVTQTLSFSRLVESIVSATMMWVTWAWNQGSETLDSFLQSGYYLAIMTSKYFAVELVRPPKPSNLFGTRKAQSAGRFVGRMGCLWRWVWKWFFSYAFFTKTSHRSLFHFRRLFEEDYTIIIGGRN